MQLQDKAIEEFLSLKYVLCEMFGGFLAHCGLGKEKKITGRW